MKKNVVKVLATLGMAAALIISNAAGAYAAPLVGSFDKSGAFRPVDGATGAATTLVNATGLDFLILVAPPGSTSPGVAGEFLVNNASGSFLALGLLGATGNINDFSFAGAGSAAYPNVPVQPLEFGLPNGVTFDLTAITGVSQVAFGNSQFLNISGTGMFSANGFDDTPGTFAFSAQGNGQPGIFTFSATQEATAAPEPASMALFGMALFGLAGAARRRFSR